MDLRLLKATVSALLLFAFAGCSEEWANYLKTDNSRFLDPTALTNKRTSIETLPIIESMSRQDQTSLKYPNAVRPTSDDLVYDDTDYVIGPSDTLEITIQGLYESVAEAYMVRKVSEEGYISLPQIDDQVKVEGLTEPQLTNKIKKVYRDAGILQDPIVILVSVASRRQQTYSVLGSVARPGTYELQRKDIRLLKAIAQAGDGVAPHIKYIYVFRQERPRKKSQIKKTDAEKKAQEEAEEEARANASLFARAAMEDTARKPRPFDISKYQVVLAKNKDSKDLDSNEAEKSNSVSSKYYMVNGVWERVAPTVKSLNKDDQDLDSNESEDVILKKSKDKRVPRGFKIDPFRWNKNKARPKSRIIAINYKKLIQGDPTMNIVIRENDIIQVPQFAPSVYFMDGKVNRPGTFSLSGRRLTVKQALAASAGPTPDAYPENAVLVRRIGNNLEQYIPINLENIVLGYDPDFFLKDNDIIKVGTEWRATFMAVIRNAFRMSYGFGFVYDRNFADPLTGPINSRRFTRW